MNFVAQFEFNEIDGDCFYIWCRIKRVSSRNNLRIEYFKKVLDYWLKNSVYAFIENLNLCKIYKNI